MPSYICLLDAKKLFTCESLLWTADEKLSAHPYTSGGKTVSKKEVQDGTCLDCYKILTSYNKMNTLFHQMTGTSLNLDNASIVKITEEEVKALYAKLLENNKPTEKTPSELFSMLGTNRNFSFETMQEYGIKHVKFVTKGPDCDCETCPKLNGMVLPIEDAIVQDPRRDELHKDCGVWVPLRE